jgi:MFS transporter, PPP family, 3-phenylpropionic acid transporter
LGMAPSYALIDSVIARAVEGRPRLSYGQLRGLASVVFMTTNVAVGALLPFLPHDSVVVIMLAAAALSIVTLPPAARVLSHAMATRAQSDNAPTADRTRWGLVLAIAVAAAFIQASHAFLMTFGSIEWRRIGVSDAAIGFSWSTGVLAEIALFYIVGQRVRSVRVAAILIVIGGCGAIVRWTTYGVGLPNALLPILQMLHALTYALTHLGAIWLVNSFSAERDKAWAQGVVASAVAIATASFTFLSGPLYERYLSGGYFAAAIVAAIGLAIALAVVARLYPQSAASGGETRLPS